MNRFFSLRAASSAARPLLAFTLLSLLAAEPALAEFSSHAAISARLPARAETGRLSISLAGSSAPEVQSLQIEIIDGDGALNNITQRTAREPIIQVTDENHHPVAGALVLFSVRQASNGAGATFNGASAIGSQDIRVYTDASGRAVGRGLRPNSTPGKFFIRATVTVGMATAFVIIRQENVIEGSNMNPPPPTATKTGTGIVKSPVKKIVIIGSIIAVGILIGVLLATRNGGAHITTGPGTVNPP